MSTITKTELKAVGIGIDVSKDKLDLAIRLSNNEYLESVFVNDSDGIDSLCGFLKKQEATCAAPLVIESTGDYHLQSTINIKQRGYLVKLINPITTKKYQNSSIRNAKTDKIDAKRLADMALLEPNLPDFKADTDSIKARKLVSLLAQLEKTKQSLVASYNRFKQIAKEIKLKHSLGDFKKAITSLENQINKTQNKLTDLLSEEQKQLADNTKGLSREKLAVLDAILAGKHFDSPDKLTAFLGMDIAVRQSGNWTGKARLSKRGNAYARKMLYQIAWGMKTHNQIFKESYAKLRKTDKHYNTILMILARKFLRYYFKCNYQCAK